MKPYFEKRKTYTNDYTFTPPKVNVKEDKVWAEISGKLAWHKNPEELAIRKKQWSDIDRNGNGYLSLSEVTQGVLYVIKLPAPFDLKPVIMRAFQAAKDKCKSKSKYGADYVERREFRLLLKYLRGYFEYWIAFDRVDTSDDHRIDFDEFCKAKDKLELWGIDMSDPEAQWKEADSNNGGKILFEEFGNWAMKKSLDLEDDDDDDEE